VVACYVRTFRRGVTAKGWRRCLAHSRQLWGCSAPPRCSQSQGALWLRNEYLARSRPRSHRSRSLLRSANMGFGGNQLGNQERAAAIEVIFSWSINTKRGVDHHRQLVFQQSLAAVCCCLETVVTGVSCQKQTKSCIPKGGLWSRTKSAYHPCVPTRKLLVGVANGVVFRLHCCCMAHWMAEPIRGQRSNSLCRGEILLTRFR